MGNQYTSFIFWQPRSYLRCVTISVASVTNVIKVDYVLQHQFLPKMLIG